ncbi:sigma intracellular receptor 2-like [Durio zibethinus]|uniref:Sigma intracellular receptor 2-like n=1 Tax=Durio zibethinus TaxID=66656 RepID=A0A6P6BF35_DURZI|nr:sigma intracellular receptor 2-like [Durio zibethinus]
MGILCKVVDTLLLVAFVVMLLAGPLIDAQLVLPETTFPDVLIRLKQRYAEEFQDYLMVEKPHFFVALVWLELVFQWPLVLLNIYGILASKPWFNTTCLIYGASVVTAMTALLGELLGSQKASDKLLKMYSPFMGLGVLALLRGLVPQSGKAPTIGKRPALARKKRA